MPATRDLMTLTDGWQLAVNGTGASVLLECPHGSSGRYAITTDADPANVGPLVFGHTINRPTIEGLPVGEFVMLRGSGVVSITEGTA